MALTQQAADHYLPISVQTLFGAEQADFDLYVRGKGQRPMLYRARAIPLADDDLERLVSSGVTTLLIDYNDRSAYEQHLRSQLTSNNDLSLTERYVLLTGAARSVFESALRGDNTAGIVNAAEEFGSQLAVTLCSRQLALHQLFELMLHDYYTFTHSANVATYCISLAQQLGVTDRTQLSQIAVGGLLHDLGKHKIPRRILNSTTKLSTAERETIQRHPQSGFEELSTSPKMSWGQLMMVYQHHERLDGRGYPVGIVGDEIDPWAKICAVADVFDALTCDRPHRSAKSVQEATSFLEQRAGKSFDQEIVQCLTSMMRHG